jgi:hypothetical protein
MMHLELLHLLRATTARSSACMMINTNLDKTRNKVTVIKLIGAVMHYSSNRDMDVENTYISSPIAFSFTLDIQSLRYRRHRGHCSFQGVRHTSVLHDHSEGRVPQPGVVPLLARWRSLLRFSIPGWCQDFRVLCLFRRCRCCIMIGVVPIRRCLEGTPNRRVCSLGCHSSDRHNLSCSWRCVHRNAFGARLALHIFSALPFRSHWYKATTHLLRNIVGYWRCRIFPALKRG